MKKLFQAGAFVYYFSIRLTHLAYFRLIRFAQQSHVAQSSYRSAYAKTQRLSASAHDGVHRLVRWLKIGVFHIVCHLSFAFLVFIAVLVIPGFLIFLLLEYIKPIMPDFLGIVGLFLFLFIIIPYYSFFLIMLHYKVLLEKFKKLIFIRLMRKNKIR